MHEPKFYFNYAQSESIIRNATGYDTNDIVSPISSTLAATYLLLNQLDEVHYVDSGSPCQSFKTSEVSQMREHIFSCEKIHDFLRQIDTSKAAGSSWLHPGLMEPLAGSLDVLHRCS